MLLIQEVCSSFRYMYASKLLLPHETLFTRTLNARLRGCSCGGPSGLRHRGVSY